MPRMILIAAGLAIVLTAPRIASAQLYRGSSSDNPNGSTVSPYLNLLNNNNIGLPAYQTQVKPILDSQNAIQRQGNSIQRLQQQVNSGTTRGGTGTGHTTFFMNYSHYYTRSSRGR